MMPVVKPDTHQYDFDFVDRAKKLHPDNAKLHELLDADAPEAGDHLYVRPEIPLSQALAAFNSGDAGLAKFYQEVTLLAERFQLYREWDLMTRIWEPSLT